MWNHSIEALRLAYGLPSTHFAARKVTIIPWDQNWLFVLLQELRTWVREGWWMVRRWECELQEVQGHMSHIFGCTVNWSDAKDAFCFWIFGCLGPWISCHQVSFHQKTLVNLRWPPCSHWAEIGAESWLTRFIGISLAQNGPKSTSHLLDLQLIPPLVT